MAFRPPCRPCYRLARGQLCSALHVAEPNQGRALTVGAVRPDEAGNTVIVPATSERPSWLAKFALGGDDLKDLASQVLEDVIARLQRLWVVAINLRQPMPGEIIEPFLWHPFHGGNLLPGHASGYTTQQPLTLASGEFEPQWLRVDADVMEGGDGKGGAI